MKILHKFKRILVLNRETQQEPMQWEEVYEVRIGSTETVKNMLRSYIPWEAVKYDISNQLLNFMNENFFYEKVKPVIVCDLKRDYHHFDTITMSVRILKSGFAEFEMFTTQIFYMERGMFKNLISQCVEKFQRGIIRNAVIDRIAEYDRGEVQKTKTREEFFNAVSYGKNAITFGSAIVVLMITILIFAFLK